MRVYSLAAVSLAPLAVLAIPIVLVENIPAAAEQYHHLPPPAPVATARPHHALPEVILDVEDAAVQVSFDNRPVTPSTDSTPEQVLEQPKPVATAYLWSLGASWKKGADLPKEAWEIVEASSITKMEIGLVEGRRAFHPCYYARLSKDHNDRLVVLLILGFIATVIVVETWSTLYSSATRALSGQGAIRLEDAEEGSCQPLSVQAEAEDKRLEPTQHSNEVEGTSIKVENEKAAL
ncbi:hypothetical protein GQ53DRAFT_772306 [Thozetella sp. PMI_491]|nr:hypothetical protein GQ53DRAFT_772306 [Thozetella sp. PMI_491]